MNAEEQRYEHLENMKVETAVPEVFASLAGLLKSSPDYYDKCWKYSKKNEIRTIVKNK